MTDDSTLLRRYAEEKSDAAFSELVGRHLDFVFSVAMREVRGDFARAQDISQNVFTALAQKASVLHRRPTLVGWLHISVHHAAAALMRSEQRRQRREQEAYAMLEQSKPSTAEDDWDRLKPVLNEVVQELGDVDRDAVLLRFYQQRPLGEIGATLRLSEDAVQKRVERALDKMRTGLVKRGITSTSAALAFMLQNHAVVAAPVGLLGTISQGATAAAGAGYGGTALFHLMSIGKIPLGIAAAFVAVGTTLVAVQQRTSADLRKEISALQQENKQIALLRIENNNAQVALRALRDVQAENERLLAEQAASGAIAGKRAPAGGGAAITGNQVKQWLAAANDPAVMARLGAEARILTLQRYAPFIAQLNLTPEQVEALVRLLNDKSQVTRDLAVVSLQNGIDPRDDPGGFQVRVAAERAAIEKKLRAFLGNDFYTQYQIYNQHLNQESTFARLELLVNGTENAFTPDQSARLELLLRANRKLSPKMVAEAQSFLSPPQIAALQQVFAIKEAVQNRIPENLPVPEEK